MPRKKVKLVVAAHRVAEARRIVDEQNTLIAKLQAAGQPTVEAQRALQSYVSALKHLEEHERMLRQENRAKRRETKKPRPH
jgi:hypothetical protein